MAPPSIAIARSLTLSSPRLKGGQNNKLFFILSYFLDNWSWINVDSIQTQSRLQIIEFANQKT